MIIIIISLSSSLLFSIAHLNIDNIERPLEVGWLESQRAADATARVRARCVRVLQDVVGQGWADRLAGLKAAGQLEVDLKFTWNYK